MRAVVMSDFGPDVRTEVCQVEQPAAEDGKTIVRVHAAGINRLSKLIRDADVPSPERLHILGNEGSGVVHSGGRFAPGTPVIIYGGPVLGVSVDGIFQEWVSIDDAFLFELPHTMNLTQGAALSVNAFTAYRAITSIQGLRAPSALLITGATGGVGFAAMQIARALSLRPIGVVSSAAKAQALVRHGFREVIDVSSAGLTQGLAAILGHTGGVPAILDPRGGSQFAQLVQLLAHGGELVAIGFVAGQHSDVSIADLIVGERRIRGYSVHAETDESIREIFPAIVSLVETGGLRPVVDSEFAPEDVEEGYRRLDDRSLVGSVLLRLHD